MVSTILKTFWEIVWVFLKPCLFVIIPVIVAFVIAFLVAYLKKKKSGTAVRKVIAHVNPKADVSLLTKLFVQLPKQYWENYYNKPIGEFREHGIIMFTGAQGQGKTIAETKYLRDIQYRYPSVKVNTNYGYYFEDAPVADWRDLVDYNNGKKGIVCAIDECQNWFSSSMSKNFPPRMLATVTQNRKNKRVIIMSAHFFMDVSKPIRKHCTEVRSCRTFLGCFTIVKRWQPIMNAEGDVIKKRTLGYYCFVHNDDLYKAYDTLRVVKNLSAAGFESDTWVDEQDSNILKAPKSTLKARRRNYNAESQVMRAMDECLNLMDSKGDDF